MECYRMSEITKYLRKFNQILCEMENRMLSRTSLSDITLDFIECMIPHHEAAIQMCENLLQYTECELLKKMASDIIETQSKGIQQMQEIANTTCGFLNSQNDVNCYIAEYLKITKKMICRMRNSAESQNINLNFITEMIPHHEGAIAMCRNLLYNCIDPRLEQVAENIIQEQSHGVEELKGVLQQICCKK